MTKIYALDDDQEFLEQLKQALQADDFLIDLSGENALEHIEAFRPDIVLLDLETPQANGFELCQTIRQHPELSGVPVVFISSSKDIDDKVRGLEVGAHDYLTKPVEAAILQVKIRLLVQMSKELKSIRENQMTAQQVAMEAMRGSSELGQAMQVIERCQLLESEEQLAYELLGLCRFFDLKAVVGMKLHHGWLCMNDDGIAKPIEQDVIISAHEKGRFIDFGSRTQINYPNIAVLIKNMPVDEAERYGRIKDSLPPVLSALDVRINILQETQAILTQTELIARSIEAVEPNLNTLSERLDKLTNDNVKNLASLLENMSLRLPRMSLDDDQEEFIMAALEQSSDMASELQQEGHLIREKLDTIALVLKGLLGRQEKIAEIARAKTEAAENAAASTPDVSDDIELF